MRIAPGSVVLGLVFAALSGCSDGAGGGASASAASTAAPKPSATAPAKASAAPSASAALPPRDDCPKDSSGPGTITQPCMAKGATRLMEAKWTGKIDDNGPYFAVTNNATLPILFGKVIVYFYDKDGKQLDVTDPNNPKGAKFVQCSGSQLFGGVMKVKEKATLSFSCVKKDVVPEGAKQVEAEIISVGFSDASEKKNEFYWSNLDLAPDTRPKGGVK